MKNMPLHKSLFLLVLIGLSASTLTEGKTEDLRVRRSPRRSDVDRLAEIERLFAAASNPSHQVAGLTDDVSLGRSRRTPQMSDAERLLQLNRQFPLPSQRQQSQTPELAARSDVDRLRELERNQGQRPSGQGRQAAQTPPPRRYDGDVIDVCSQQFLVSTKTDKRTWESAFEKCSSSGLKLLSLEDGEKMACLNDHFDDYDGHSFKFWTSGRRDEQSSQFFWASTSKWFSYTSWKSNEPDNHNDNEECVLATLHHAGSSYQAVWSDEKCAKRQRYICDIP